MLKYVDAFAITLVVKWSCVRRRARRRDILQRSIYTVGHKKESTYFCL